MKKRALRFFLIFTAASVFTLVAFLTLLLEPAIKINGYARLDKNKLNSIYDTVTITYPDAKTLLVEKVNENNGEFIPIEKISGYTKNAFIAIEDKRFYSHHGVDYLRVMGAAKNNVLSGSFKEGASTITQQLVKNTHLKNDKTIKRKLQEIRIAKDLERNYTKNEILEMYLNILYFGNNNYGIAAASQNLFGKSVARLTLAESATLAGIINNPSLYNPIVKPQNAIKRRNTVLSRMYAQKMITLDEYMKASEEKLAVNSSRKSLNQYSRACLYEAAKALRCDKTTLFRKKITIVSHCDKSLQRFVTDIIGSNCVKNGEISIIVTDNSDNKVLACASDSALDISDLKRQPGSTIKPFVCYAPTLELGEVHTSTPILDEKTDFGDWSPANFNDKYYGWTSVEESLINSLNVPAVKLLEISGLQRAKSLAEKFGLEFARDDNSLAIALGGMSDGLTLQQINDAYRCLANLGISATGRYIKSIIDGDGNVIYKDGSDTKTRAISEETAYLITDCLKKCAQNGTARLIGTVGKNIAAKTGTVGNKNGNTDAYCVAYTPEYTVSVRISSKSGLMENVISGGGLPTILARKVFEFLSPTNIDFKTPNGITSAEIDIDAWKNEHKVVLAKFSTPPISRKKVLFNKEYIPKHYPEFGFSFNDSNEILDDFNNFKIIDGFFDKGLNIA